MLASAGNAGLIAPGHSFAWASPTAPAELLRSLTVEDTALRINPLKAPGMALWGLKFLRECNAERSSKNTLVKLRLAQYSQRMLDQISADEHIDYDDIHEGLLYLYRDQKRFEAGVKKMKFLQDHGQKQDVLNPDGIVEAEPYFAPVKDKLAGAIYGVTDSSGDSVKFTHKLQEALERRVHRLRDHVRRARPAPDPQADPRPAAGGGGVRQGHVSGVQPADDAGRAADPRSGRAGQPVHQQRPRPHGLHDGVRVEQARGGRDRRQENRHPDRRTDAYLPTLRRVVVRKSRLSGPHSLYLCTKELHQRALGSFERSISQPAAVDGDGLACDV